MDHAQGIEQRRQFGRAVEMGAGQHVAGQAGTSQLAADALLDLPELFLQRGVQLRVRGQLLALYQAAQHGQRGFQRMAEVAQRMPRTLQGFLGLRQQVVDLRDQRLQLHGCLAVQLLALALLQLGDLLAGALQWAQGQGHGVALQQQEYQQCHAHQAQPAQAYPREAVENRRVVLRHTDDDRLAVTPVFGTKRQQALPLRALQQFGRQAGGFRPCRNGIPERA